MNSNKASLDLHLHQSDWENSIVALFYAHPNVKSETMVGTSKMRVGKSEMRVGKSGGNSR